MTSQPMTWTLPEAAGAAGIQYRTAYNWLQRGLLTASVRPVNGSGNAVLLSDDDLIKAVLLGAVHRLLSSDGLALIADAIDGTIDGTKVPLGTCAWCNEPVEKREWAWEYAEMHVDCYREAQLG